MTGYFGLVSKIGKLDFTQSRYLSDQFVLFLNCLVLIIFAVMLKRPIML